VRPLKRAEKHFGDQNGFPRKESLVWPERVTKKGSRSSRGIPYLYTSEGKRGSVLIR